MAVGGIVTSLMPFAFEHLPDMFSLIGLGSRFKSLLAGSTTNEAVIAGIEELAPKFMPMLESIGTTMFPKLKPALHVLAGVVTSFDHDKTRWLQQSVNSLLPDQDDIPVDGIYGPQTRDAVELVQKQLNLTVDGFAGKITQLAIDAALNMVFAQNTGQQAITKQVLAINSIVPKASDKSVEPSVILSPAIMGDVSGTTGKITAARSGMGRPVADY